MSIYIDFSKMVIDSVSYRLNSYTFLTVFVRSDFHFGFIITMFKSLVSDLQQIRDPAREGK